MLALPTGLHKAAAEDPGTDCTYVYARGHWNAPVLALPALQVRAQTPDALRLSRPGHEWDAQPASGRGIVLMCCEQS